MAADNSSRSNSSGGSNNIDLTNILSAVQNWVTAENSLNKQLASVISSNHLNLNLTGISTTVGTVTTINTSIGLTGGPISTTGTLAVSLAKITFSTSANIAISNSVYTDGPSIAQGTSGVWYVSGTVTLLDTVGATTNSLKLWDSTTVIASDRFVTTGGGCQTRVHYLDL